MKRARDERGIIITMESSAVLRTLDGVGSWEIGERVIVGLEIEKVVGSEGWMDVEEDVDVDVKFEALGIVPLNELRSSVDGVSV